MAGFAIRWSALEARKAYASPFGVTFVNDAGVGIGGIAVNGPDLVYYSQFQQAVLRLAGELFSVADVEAASDPQRAWLDVLGTKVAALQPLHLRAESFFDEQVHERRFRFAVLGDNGGCHVGAGVVADYQELQAALAHLTGRLYRNAQLEAIDDIERRRISWMHALRTIVTRPSEEDRIAEVWPW